MLGSGLDFKIDKKKDPTETQVRSELLVGTRSLVSLDLKICNSGHKLLMFETKKLDKNKSL